MLDYELIESKRSEIRCKFDEFCLESLHYAIPRLPGVNPFQFIAKFTEDQYDKVSNLKKIMHFLEELFDDKTIKVFSYSTMKDISFQKYGYISTHFAYMLENSEEI